MTSLLSPSDQSPSTVKKDLNHTEIARLLFSEQEIEDEYLKYQAHYDQYQGSRDVAARDLFRRYRLSIYAPEYFYDGPRDCYDIDDFVADRNFFDEDWFMIDDKEVVLEVARRSCGSLKWMPRRFMDDLDVFLVAAVNHGVFSALYYFELEEVREYLEEKYEHHDFTEREEAEAMIDVLNRFSNKQIFDEKENLEISIKKKSTITKAKKVKI